MHLSIRLYDAQRVLFAIAKFLDHLLGEGYGWSKMGGSRGRERPEGREIGMHEGKPQNAIFHIWHLRTPLGATALCHHFRKLFSRATLPHR